MKLDYKGLKDCHLNVFYGYAGEHLENNITKAFINTFDSFDESTKKEICERLLSVKLPQTEIETVLYLQKKPDENLIKSVPAKNRFIIGLSPTGKCWGFKGEDTCNKQEITEEWKNDHPDATDEECKEVVDSVLQSIEERRKHDSIPDAWIIIISNGTPLYVIAFENKLYNLDPIQINNHIEKSLFQTEEKNEPIYFKYAEIAEILKKTQTYMGFQFVEYLTILGHLKITSLPLSCSAHADIRNKVRFTPCHTVMQDIFSKSVDKRNPTAIRKHLNKDSYLREINLCFEKEDYIYISLAMGPTMNSAKAMYREFNPPLQFSDKHIQKPWSNFHLQYQRGRNIGQSYRNDQPEWPVEEYIAYWRNHADQLKMMSSAEAADYIEKNCDDLHLSAQKAGELVSLLRNRKNPVNIVPELIYEIRWSCEEIANMKDNAEFEASLKAALKEFLDAINYEVSGINC